MSLFFSQFQFLNTPDTFNPLPLAWVGTGLHEISMCTNRKPVLCRVLRSTNRSGMPARTSNLFAEGSRAVLSTRQHFELEDENDPPISMTKILCLSFSPSQRLRLRNALRPGRRLYRLPRQRHRQGAPRSTARTAGKAGLAERTRERGRESGRDLATKCGALVTKRARRVDVDATGARARHSTWRPSNDRLAVVRRRGSWSSRDATLPYAAPASPSCAHPSVGQADLRDLGISTRGESFLNWHPGRGGRRLRVGRGRG